MMQDFMKKVIEDKILCCTLQPCSASFVALSVPLGHWLKLSTFEHLTGH
jgi:hypothetical protein